MTPAAKRYADCAAQGMTQLEAARHLGVTRQAVAQMANRHNIKFKDGSSRVEIDLVMLGEMVGSGMSLRGISKSLGVSTTAVSTRLREIGLKARHGNRMDPLIVAKVVEMGLAGDLQKDIAAATGLHQSEVSRVLLANGIRRSVKKGTLLTMAPKLQAAGHSIKDIAEALCSTERSVRFSLYRARKAKL